MPSRHDLFENHQFTKLWRGVIATADEMKAPIDATSDQLQNFTRLQKAVAYVEKLVSAIDKDLVPESLWNNCQAPTANLLSHIQANEAQPNGPQVDTANAHIDTLIQYVSPFALTNGKAASAAGAALAANAKAIAKHTTELETSTLSVLERGETLENRLRELLSAADEAETEIKRYEEDLFEDKPDELSTKTKIESLEAELSDLKDEIESARDKIAGSSSGDENSVLSTSIRNQEHITKLRKKAETDLQEMASQLSDLDDAHSNVIGYSSEDGEQIEGIQKKYENLVSALKLYDADQRQRHEALTEEIRGLLPGALSAGLASSFATRRDQYTKPIRDFGRLFYFAVVLLVLAGVSGLFSIVDGSMSFAAPTDWNSLIIATVRRAPLVLPLVWLAYFAAKRRNEYRRLEEEYAHKETIARSYQSFKQQVEELGEGEKEKLETMLLSAAIQAVSANASKALDKDHDDKLPMIDRLVGDNGQIN